MSQDEIKYMIRGDTFPILFVKIDSTANLGDASYFYNPELARLIGEAMSQELHNHGVNVTFDVVEYPAPSAAESGDSDG